MKFFEFALKGIAIALTALALIVLTSKLAWADEAITVAVIDTGADIRHPDLTGHIWVNPGETGLDEMGRDKAFNGKDDDGNGFVDDVHGWNFVDASPDFMDRHGHGTHIGGIISQVAPEARLMFLKYYDPKASEMKAMSNAVRAIQYATRMGARVINFSAGGPLPDAAEKAAIAGARDRGILFVAAAGNDGRDTDVRPYFPASYGLSNILSVTAIDRGRKLLPTSNFGLSTVHLAAPGEAIQSALPKGKRGSMTGTSQATAFASATAARLLARGRMAPEDAISHLIQSGELERDLIGKTRARTVLSTERALSIRGRDPNTTNVGAVDARLFSPEIAQPLSTSPER